MNNPKDSLKNILSEVGPKPGIVAVNTAGFMMMPLLFALLYSLIDPVVSKVIILILVIAYILAQPVLAVLETYFGIVTKILRSKAGRYLFCR
jgi:hypothetical protein